jgi:hypothetical protein
MEKHDYVANGIAVHEDGFKFTHDYWYIVIKHEDEEKAKLIHEFITTNRILCENFTRDMINCKYDCYTNNHDRYIKNKTVANSMCYYDADTLISLLDKVDDYIGEYEYQNEKYNYETDIQKSYGEEKWKLLINKIRCYKEDREKPNKLIGRNF